MADDLLSIFRVEAAEYLAALNSALLGIETLREGDPAYHKALIEMNRIAHSMKGAARAVGFGLVERLAHDLEDVFDAALRDRLGLTPDVCDTLYDSLDLIQAVMSGETPGDDALDAVLGHFAALRAEADPDLTTDSQQFAVIGAADEESDDLDLDYADYVGGGAGARAGHDSDDTVESAGVGDAAHLAGGTGELPALDGLAERYIRPAPHDQGADETLTAEQISPPDDARPRAQRDPDRPNKRATQTVPAINTGVQPAVGDEAARRGGLEVQTLNLRPLEETVRVAVSKLDRLMAEATELLVARMHGDARLHAVNDLRRAQARWAREWRTARGDYIRLARRVGDQTAMTTELTTLFKFLEVNQRNLLEMGRRLNQLAQMMTGDNLHLATLSEGLQDEISAMRLVPFDTLVPGYQRIVRDLARELGKQVNFDVQGAYVEIDKAVLDALKDPIMHLLRNAVDHGIGGPDERVAKGHSPTGRVSISVEQRGGEIVIAISDDGRGISTSKIRRALLRQGLLSEAELDALNDDEVRFYIFHPGFTTNEGVTAISGRGFGMDIVRDRVESLRGRIGLQSEKGAGTTITLNVPVSLTRVRCILFQIGEAQLALPSVVVQRMESVPPERIFTAEGQEMIVVNGAPTPLIALGAIIGAPSFGRPEGGLAQVMLVQAANRAVALEVDRLLSERELVLKPLGPELAEAQFVSGAALLSEGGAIIVLDANDLVRATGGGAFTGRRRIAATLTMPKVAARRTRALVVDDSITTRTLEKNILETAGYEVQVAMDGDEAWAMLTEARFDVVISDVEMPNMNGLELTRRIKSHPELRQIPVVLLTSLGKGEQREAGLRAGANAYLVKSSFDQGDLLATIESVL